jgi:translation initiation factor eIF-2B subunit alpha
VQIFPLGNLFTNWGLNTNFFKKMGFDIILAVTQLLAADESLAVPVAAIQALVQSVSKGNAKTYQELMKNLEDCCLILKTHGNNRIAFQAGGDLFVRYVINFNYRSISRIQLP